MNFTKGGRGKKAPYKTTHVRVPIPVLERVKGIVDQYKSGLEDIENNNLTYSIPNLDKSIEISKSVLRSRKSARVSLAKLLTELYGQNVHPDELK